MAVGAADREVFRRIGEAESVPRQGAASFAAALLTLDRLIVRRRAMFPGREFKPTDDEFRAHEALYVRARVLGIYRG